MHLTRVCTFKTSPCVRTKRPRVYVQNVPVYAGTTRTLIVFRRRINLTIQRLNCH